MRRRLTLALLGVALLAVILVGAGVLLLAQVGARSEAQAQVERQLDALIDVAAEIRTPDRLRPALGRIAEGFDIGDAALVAVTDDGQVVDVGREERVARLLDDEQLRRLRSSETVLINDARHVVGFRRTGTTLTRGPLADTELAIMVRQDVSPLAPQARAWFALSALGVLAIAAIVSRWLAGRFARPIQEIEQATARIAAGDLAVRVVVDSDDEFGQLGEAVNRMTEHLEHAQAAEQEFLMSVSHDLRTPLTVIAGYAEALADDAVDDTSQAGAVIGDHADRLSHLVGDLLDLARMNQSEFQLDPVPVELDAVVERVAAGLDPRASAADVTLERRLEPVMAVADPVRLEQVIGNLIDNGLKFAGGRMTLAVRTDGDRALIVVGDDGPGISDADLPHIFERLYVTGAQPVRAENSSGLGLAIVQQLVTAMGGRVRAERDPELGGTRMTIELTRYQP